MKKSLAQFALLLSLSAPALGMASSLSAEEMQKVDLLLSQGSSAMLYSGKSLSEGLDAAWDARNTLIRFLSGASAEELEAELQKVYEGKSEDEQRRLINLAMDLPPTHPLLEMVTASCQPEHVRVLLARGASLSPTTASDARKRVDDLRAEIGGPSISWEDRGDTKTCTIKDGLLTSFMAGEEHCLKSFERAKSEHARKVDRCEEVALLIEEVSLADDFRNARDHLEKARHEVETLPGEIEDLKRKLLENHSRLRSMRPEPEGSSSPVVQ